MGFDGTIGALLIGTVGALFLSGILATQVFMYIKFYPKDRTKFKVMVALVWILDLAHSALICVANWFYLIDNFSNQDAPKQINWSVDATVALTAITTLIVHLFFTQRVFTLSKKNLWIAGLSILLVVLRVVSALSCMAQMSKLKTWDNFRHSSEWLWTAGLSISAAADVLIAGSLIVLLRRSRTGWESMDHMIKYIVVYTIENGLLTSLFAVLSLICWVTMSTNLIFLALHFTISKLYANSLLTALNARNELQQRTHTSSGQQMSVLFPSRRFDLNRSGEHEIETIMQINVEKTVHRVTDSDRDPDAPDLRFHNSDDQTDDSVSKKDHQF
ncbi:hypothetical protein BDY19DRAFT_61740 [Irpex rosettiformis]|uniref:Uncharacterized protein n=1 Tax=Irpex rosettiformis TaxID=378272 RepID=A0ACB8ULJ1_9APHY|nr:hypothetical protein BDY19DRAFT_61740 [Irpex rosettiformis]